MRLCRRLFVASLVSLLMGSAAWAQVTTGSITGTVADRSGGVLPGVTVTLSGATIIGGLQTQTTDVAGHYRFDRLSPGEYRLRFELPGFKAVDYPSIRVSATFTATVDALLDVGQVEETVVVTGESPVVDVKSNVQQTVMNQELLEGVPTGRDVWSVAKIIPGVTVSTYDVGGTQGMQQSGMSAHGSRSDDKTFAIDGLAVNWPGGGGGSTMVYYDQGMFEEVNYQTSAIPAEVPIGGIFMNMVTKAGSNLWKGDARYYFANDSLQAENFAAVSAKYQFPGGNPVKTQYDFNATLAGPVQKNRIWLFGSFRRWRVDKVVLAVTDPTGGHPVDDNMIWNASAKITAQIRPDHRLGVVYNYNWKNRYHRNDGGQAFIESQATTLQHQPGYTGQAKYTGVFGSNTVFESTMGGVAGTYPERYQPGVKPTDLRREDSVLSTATVAAPGEYENPNYRFQFDNVVSHTRTGLGGTHDFKAGVQFARQFFREKRRVNGDIVLLYNNGAPTAVRAYNTPVVATSYVHQLGFFGQDSWTARRLTLNVGVRVDRANGWIPEQTSPAGRWVGERHIDRRDVYNQWIAVWRAGAVYDLTGNGHTAIKGNWSRYGTQVGIGLVTNVHPFTASTANISWTDRNGNNLPEPDELGVFEGFTGAASTRYADADGPAWSYSDEITVGVERELMPDLRVSAMYYHRTNRRDVGNRNAAVPPTAYTAVDVTNPLGATVTLYNLDRAYLGKQDLERDTIDLLDADYNGFEVTAVKRFTRGWQMLFGFTAGRNRGGQSFGEFNDPNNLVNQQGIVGNDATFQTKLVGTYLLPRAAIAISGSILRNTGYPRQFTYSVTRSIYPGLTRSSQTLRVNERGDERRPDVTLIDLRFSRPFRLGGGRTIEPQVDVFNIANSDVILNMVDAIGPRLGYPSEILAPRIVRFGVAVRW